MEAAIFGVGNRCEKLKRGLEKYCGVQICAIFDNDENKWGKKIDNVVISSTQKLTDINFDKIFICIMKKAECNEIEIQLENMGIPREKIVPMRTTQEYEDAYIEEDPIRKNWIKAFSEYTKEIGMLGSVAECGVYFGDTAIFINKYWSDRPLHLFDTFEGFPDKDHAYDMNTFPAFKHGSFATYDFKRNASSDFIIEVIKSRMRYPDNLKIQ